MDLKAAALKLHADNKGKISIESKVPVKTNEDLALAYTPGVAEPCKVIYDNPEAVYDYTAKGNLVGLISDGSAVLGLGNIGPEAAIPVMEGKSILFKEFANIDTMPLCLATQDTAEIIKTVQYLAPTFGGINLEDISSPRCFEIEKVLDETLDIPVFHDDQHGTAIVVAAGVINGLKLVGKELPDVKVVLNGPGAAGTAIIKMLLNMGVTEALICDEHGILAVGRPEPMDPHKQELAQATNPENRQGDLAKAIQGADVFIGVSVANALSAEMVKTMAVDPIVFAMANPVPEIMYDVAKEAGVKVMGTGRSDFPNQINNVLAFPGIFRGALDVRATTINNQMKIAAAEGIAALISAEDLREDYIIPSPFDKRVVEQVANYVAQAAIETGVNRLPQKGR
ncbi:malic enzyme-like NAD(P)-binding protein [uncultured Vagococcus sp.]|uniref:NAD(P)-dependent malic enzyme n=1 Tax=uncultured Vagococcus sp. TaxID=189676 RepID=UPI0028D244D6|nr:malic enzyme-like NAD(P)-binding protein [uncultured Vagococcus sp.]